MENSKEDVRTIRTKRDLANALEELLQERNFDDFTIKDITDKALMSKNTFYNNFKDKNDLLMFLFHRYSAHLIETVEPWFEKHKLSPRSILLKKAVDVFVDYFYESNLPYRKMIQNDTSKSLFWNLNQFIIQLFNELRSTYFLSHNSKKTKEPVESYFYSGAISSLIYNALRNNEDLDRSQLKKDLFFLCLPGMK